MKHAQSELLMNVQITPNEVIAVNLAISYYQRYCKHISPVYPEASELLDQFQRRVYEQLPPEYRTSRDKS